MKKGTSTHPEVFMELARAYEVGNTIITERIESILTPNAASLPEALQNALDKFGDTPIAEPKLHAALQSGDRDEFAKLCSVGVNLDDYDAIEASTFVSRVRTKILTDMDKDGVFKTTPLLDSMRLPKLSEVRAFSDSVEGKGEAELEESMMELIGLSGVELSKWEKDLVRSIVISYTQATTDALLGKVTDRTPFSRYLKNK